MLGQVCFFDIFVECVRIRLGRFQELRKKKYSPEPCLFKKAGWPKDILDEKRQEVRGPFEPAVVNFRIPLQAINNILLDSAFNRRQHLGYLGVSPMTDSENSLFRDVRILQSL